MIYENNDKIFEWNDEKAKLNKIKHGVSFKYAVRVFDDDNKIIFYDEFHSQDEDRYNVIGKVDEVLFVVFTERKENFRIISARKATEFERSLYYGF